MKETAVQETIEATGNKAGEWPLHVSQYIYFVVSTEQTRKGDKQFVHSQQCFYMTGKNEGWKDEEQSCCSKWLVMSRSRLDRDTQSQIS